jgi:HEAT repeat protein
LVDHHSLLELFYKRYSTDKEVAASTRQHLRDNKDLLLPYVEAFLSKSLEDGNLQNQSISVLLLGEMPSTKSVDILLTALSDKRFNHAGQIPLIHALAQSDDERVIPIFLEIIGGPSHPAWENAQDGLSRLGESAIPKIVDLFHTGNTNIRRGAVQRLGFYPLHPLALPTLLKATHVADALIRSEAVVGLSRFRYPEALAQLLNLLHDPDKLVRKQVYTSLIVIDPYTALTVFIGLLKNPNPAICEEVSEILVLKPIAYFGLGSWLGHENLTNFYNDNSQFRQIKGLASSADIKALLSNTEVIYGTNRVCDITSTVLKAIDMPLGKALLSVGR